MAELQPSPGRSWDEVAAGDFGKFLEQERQEASRLLRAGVPENLRWKVWSCLLRVDVESAAEVPKACRSSAHWRQIEVDLPRTFPEENFDECLQQQLGNVLCAYATKDPLTGYCQSMNYIAGLLLLVSSDEHQSLQAFEAMMQRYGLSGLFRDGLPLMMKYCYVSLSQLRLRLPELHDHFRRLRFRPAQYLQPWLLTLFIKLLPLRIAQYFWDFIFFEGEAAVVTLSLLVLRACEPFLLFLDDVDIGRFFELIRVSDKLGGPWENSLERFWFELFQSKILKDFDEEHRQVLEQLHQDPARSYSAGILDMEAEFPARPAPPERLAEMVNFLPSASEASRSASAFLGFKRLTDPFVVLSADAREGVNGAMQRLHNILDKPNATRSRQRRLRDA